MCPQNGHFCCSNAQEWHNRIIHSWGYVTSLTRLRGFGDVYRDFTCHVFTVPFSDYRSGLSVYSKSQLTGSHNTCDDCFQGRISTSEWVSIGHALSDEAKNPDRRHEDNEIVKLLFTVISKSSLYVKLAMKHTAVLEYALSSVSVLASTKRRRKFGRLNGFQS